MNIPELVEKVAQRADVTKSIAKSVLDAVFDEIEQSLHDGQEVKLGSVGKLHVKVDGPRTVTGFGKTQEIGSRKAVRFKAFTAFKGRLNPKAA